MGSSAVGSYWKASATRVELLTLDKGRLLCTRVHRMVIRFFHLIKQVVTNKGS